MLTAEQNQQLTQVSPGTPMGELLRRYWHPVSTTGELHENPVRSIKLLGEELTLFQSRSGKLGLVDRRCAHRRLDLRWGIPQKDALRCAYHGWTYTTDGQCVDQPGEPLGSRFKDKIRISNYPVVELGGLIWAYIGPTPIPALPRWRPLVVENAFRHVATTVLPCNWLQCMENSVDPLHAEHLHGYLWEYVVERYGEAIPNTKPAFDRLKRKHHRLEFEPFEFGIIKRRILEGQDETASDWLHGHPLIFPNAVTLGIPGMYQIEIRVPRDDSSTWCLIYQAFVPGNGVTVPEQPFLPTYEDPVNEIPDYVAGQDLIAWRDQGTIVDRSLEQLGDSDRGLILYRRMLQEQIQVVQDGGDPINVFRTDAEAKHLVMEGHEYGEWLGPYEPGTMYLRTAGPFSPVLEIIENLLTQASKSQGYS